MTLRATPTRAQMEVLRFLAQRKDNVVIDREHLGPCVQGKRKSLSIDHSKGKEVVTWYPHRRDLLRPFFYGLISDQWIVYVAWKVYGISERGRQAVEKKAAA